MKAWATVLFLVFALNILAEMGGGECLEDRSQDGQKIEQAQKHVIAETAHHDAADTAEHDHFCHFGHCSHMTIVATPMLPNGPLAPLSWVVQKQNPVWRNLTPLLKPPIA